jgi:predicted DsbA family dithiol-disulfide isomerase
VTAAARAPQPAPLAIEAWSDVVCSWCYIGKRHLERALAAVADVGEVTVRWRSFELDPGLPADAGSADEELARRRGISLAEARAMHEETERRGAELGIAFDFRRARRGNTFDAHRVLHMAGDRGCQAEIGEALMAAYFSEGRAIGDPAALADVAGAAGLPRDAVAAMLASDRYAAEVRRDEAEAAELGITGVPFFVLDRRYAVAGAQPPDVLAEALKLAWAARDGALQREGGGWG